MSNQLDIQEILKNLPHRYPFLLVDRVLSYVENEEITAIKNVTYNEEIFQGHFPDKAVMPGVLMIEALAQTAGILAFKSTEFDPKTSLFYLASIGETRFKKIVIPGDQLKLNVKVQKKRKTVWKFSCVASVDGIEVCTTEMTCMQNDVND